jgi:endonuclease YncB( thermonuclease family)
MTRQRQPHRRRGRRRILPRNLALALLFIGALFIYERYKGSFPRLDIGQQAAQQESRAAIICQSPNIIDGDTFDCGGHRIRMASIDAPEISSCAPGRRCTPGDGQAAKAYLYSLTRELVTCYQTDTDRYGRTVALCKAAGRDLSCDMVASGHAIERYGTLSCR